MNTREVAATIRSQINPLVLMSLGAHGFHYGMSPDGPFLGMTVKVLPFRKDGTRGTAARKMTLTVTLTYADLYTVRVCYSNKGDIVEHVRFDDIYNDQLSEVLLSIDSDEDRK